MAKVNYLVAVSLLFSLYSKAEIGGINLNQTRVIFIATDKAQTITINNSEQRAYLIQTSVQNELDNTTPAPFIITPPLFSLQGDSRQNLNILPQGSSLPIDRESLFYLSISAVPAHSAPITDGDRLSVGIRFLIKLFYRPQGLEPYVNEVPCLLTFKQDAQGMKVTNPTAYYQTLGMLSIDGRNIELSQQPTMISPRDSITLTTAYAKNNLIWRTITDYGGLSPECHQTNLTPVEKIQ